MTLLEAVGSFALVFILADFVEPLIYHRRNRERIEMFCIEESPYKTYFDNVVTNLLITLPIVLAFAVVVILVDAIAG
jgi:hypothetical protein